MGIDLTVWDGKPCVCVCVCVCVKTANGRYPLVRTSPRLASAAAAAARTRRRRSLARRLATRLAADVRCARPTVRSVACAALRAALRALLRLHCLSLLLLVVVVLLLLLGYHTSGRLCGERTLTTAQKLSERTNRARIISICPLHNIVGV